MPWLFTVLIALFYCASSGYGQKISAVQNSALKNNMPITLISRVYDNKITELSMIYTRKPVNELRHKQPKVLLLLPPYRSFLLATFQLLPSYTLVTDFGYRYFPQQQINAPIHEPPQQVNWMLHSSPQQSRLGGWKESNILYRGSLTYHS